MGRGSLPWTAPEVRESDASFSCASDIFGLGVLFWEMITQENPKEQADIEPSTWNPPREPEYLVQLLTGCWQRDPNNRLTIEGVMKLLPTGMLTNMVHGF